MSSAFNVLKKVSVTALSQQLPLPDIDTWKPVCAKPSGNPAHNIGFRHRYGACTLLVACAG
jgi:hypothetical protein